MIAPGQLITRISTNNLLLFELVFQFEFECRARGADILAYPPVVAGGNRSNTLHYVKNNQLIKVNHTPSSYLKCIYVTHCPHMHPLADLFWLNRSKHFNVFKLEGKRILSW